MKNHTSHTCSAPLAKLSTRYASPTLGADVLACTSFHVIQADGSETKPYSSVAAAVEAAGSTTKTKNATIVLRAGVYYEKQMLLTTNHSGLTIQNFEGERVSS